MSQPLRKESLRQAAPALLVGGGVFVLALARTGSPPVAAAVGALATLFLGPPVWVGWDAQRLGLRHPIAWGLFALFTTPIGAVIYYLLRPDASKASRCSSCQRTVLDKYTACPWCGTPCEEVCTGCPGCRAAVEDGWSFCPYCRLNLTGSSESSSESTSDQP